VRSTDTKSACWTAEKLPADEPTVGFPEPKVTEFSVHALVTGETSTVPGAVTFETYRTRVARLIVAEAGMLERSKYSNPSAVGDTTTVAAGP
jgi:hypothetical protein